MQFGMLSPVDPEKDVLDEVQMAPREGALLWVSGRLKSIVKHRILGVGQNDELCKNGSTAVNDL